MASWSELTTVAPLINGQQVADTVWAFHMDAGGNGCKQKVFVTYELMQPDFECLRITAAVSMMSLADPE